MAAAGAQSRSEVVSPTRFVVTMLIIVFAVELGIMVAFQFLPPLPALVETVLDAGTLTVIAGGISWAAIGRPFHRALLEGRRDVARAREELLEQARSRDLDSSILRGLDLAETEDEVVAVVRHTLATAVPGNPSELLMADSSHAHLRVVADNPSGSGPGCSVSTPAGCPAVRRGHPLQFASSDDIDACPRLRDRGESAVSAVCVPIALLGRAAGVLHVTGPAGSPPDPATVERLRLLGGGVGSRLGMVRTLNDSALAASLDPLTGLLNRRSLESKVTVLQDSGRHYSVIALDLDHFKKLNDTHGHLTGDQALRLFARVLRSGARDSDLVARLGGEEFAVVVPDATAAEAANLAERIRLELAHALTDAAVPGFTVSAGVADTTEAETFEEVAALADRRLYVAKQGGRDRVASASVS